MALVFDRSDDFRWQARWIAPAGTEMRKNCYIQLRKRFQVGVPSAPALLRICAENRYQARLNGIDITVGPVRGTRMINYYDIHDVTELLRPGENELVIFAHAMNVETYIVDCSPPAVIAEIAGITATDATWEARIDTRFRSDTIFYTEQVGFSQWCDFNIPPVPFAPATELAPEAKSYTKKLLPRNIEALANEVVIPVDFILAGQTPPLEDPDDLHIARVQTREPYSPVSDGTVVDGAALLSSDPGRVTTIFPPAGKDGVSIILDFGRELIGYLEVTLRGGARTVVDINHEEELANDRLVSCHEPLPYNFCDRYILDGSVQTIGNVLYDRGFRMVQITLRNLTAPVTIQRIRMCDCRYPYTARGRFFCSDMQLNRIHDVCVETLRCCTTDIFLDCPWRERAFWVNDLIVENKTSLIAFGAVPLHARAFELALSQMFPDVDLIPGMSPSGSFSNRKYILLPTNLLVILTLRDYYWYSGDRDTVMRFLPILQRILDTFDRFANADGQLVAPDDYWNFFDWSFELNRISLNGKNSALLNYLYIKAIDDFCELADLSAGKGETVIYRERQARCLACLEETFFDPETRRMADYVDAGKRRSDSASQLTAALALQSRRVSEAIRPDLVAQLDDPNCLTPELYMQYFTFRQLEQHGNPAAALARIRNYWGRNIDTGSPTMYEAAVHKFGKASFSGYGSLCHGFSTSPLEFFQRVILGIYPLESGFRSFAVMPQMLGLRFAQGMVPTPYGNIKVRWHCSGDGKVELQLSHPPECHPISDYNP